MKEFDFDIYADFLRFLPFVIRPFWIYTIFEEKKFEARDCGLKIYHKEWNIEPDLNRRLDKEIKNWQKIMSDIFTKEINATDNQY